MPHGSGRCVVHWFGVVGDEIVNLRSTRGIHPSGSLPFGGRGSLPRTTFDLPNEVGPALLRTFGTGWDGQVVMGPRRSMGQLLNHALPITFSSGTGPNERES